MTDLAAGRCPVLLYEYHMIVHETTEHVSGRAANVALQ